MKDRLLDILACPTCRAPLRLADGAVRSQSEVETGELVCGGEHRFTIRNFIPRFVDSDAYVKSFSFQWDIYRRAQLDSLTGQTQTADRWRDMTGLGAVDVAGKLALDVGCGPGKFIEAATGLGAEVVGMDLSFAVDAALDNFGLRDDIHLVQADVFHPPFKSGSFDLIFSLGVLHHTPDCEQAFKQLPDLLKPGGRVAIWVYAQEIIPHFNRRLRSLTRQLPPRLLYWLCLLPVPVTYLFNIPYLRAPFYSLKPYFQWIYWGNFRQRWLDTFDWYSCWYQSSHSYPEVHGWFQDMGLSDIRLQRMAVSVSGRR